jgi:hypothetical protein
MSLGAAYAGRELAKRGGVNVTIWAHQKIALDAYEKAVELWRSIGGLDGANRLALAESLKGVGLNSSQCTDSGRRGYALEEEMREAMQRRAEEASVEALEIYEEMQSPELGGMYKVGNDSIHAG